MNIILFVIFLSSLTCIFLVNFVLGNKPEFWDYGFETGVVFNGLSLSFVAAYIFYFIDIVIPKWQRTKLVNANIVNPGISLIRSIETFFEDLILVAEDKIVYLDNEVLTKERLEEILVQIKVLDDRIPLQLNSSLKEMTIFESILSLESSLQIYMKEMLTYSDIDIKLLICLRNLENSTIWKLARKLNEMIVFNTSLKNSIKGEIFLDCLYDLQIQKEEYKKAFFNKVSNSQEKYTSNLVDDERIKELRKKYIS